MTQISADREMGNVAGIGAAGIPAPLNSRNVIRRPLIAPGKPRISAIDVLHSLPVRDIGPGSHVARIVSVGIPTGANLATFFFSFSSYLRPSA